MNSKDKSIRNLIKNILTKFASNQVKVKDYWDGDLCATGFTDKNEKYIIYVSTFDRLPNYYYVSIEKNTPEEERPYLVINNFENIHYTELEILITKYLT